MVKNCDLGLGNAVFSRPRSQFFTIRTSQPANNIYLLHLGQLLHLGLQQTGPPGFNDDGSRFPRKSYPLLTCFSLSRSLNGALRRMTQ